MGEDAMVTLFARRNECEIVIKVVMTEHLFNMGRTNGAGDEYSIKRIYSKRDE